MAMSKCKECGGEISTKAKKCPKCGVSLKARVSTGGLLKAFGFLLLAAIAIPIFIPNSSSPSNNTSKVIEPNSEASQKAFINTGEAKNIERETELDTESLPQQRMAYGGSACKDMSPWKQFTDDVLAGDVDNIEKYCTWFEQGREVLGPIQITRYRDHSFSLVALPNGKLYWIETSNL